jgi:hypothetical protein
LCAGKTAAAAAYAVVCGNGGMVEAAGSRAAEGAKRLGSLRRYQYSVVPVELYASHAYRRCTSSSFSSSIAVVVDTTQLRLSFLSFIFCVLFFLTFISTTSTIIVPSITLPT